MGRTTRVRAWLHQRKLDRSLAAGSDPNGDPVCAQRAETLVDPSARNRLAASREELACSRPPIDTLVERLRAPGKLRQQGVPRPCDRPACSRSRAGNESGPLTDE